MLLHRRQDEDPPGPKSNHRNAGTTGKRVSIYIYRYLNISNPTDSTILCDYFRYLRTMNFQYKCNFVCYDMPTLYDMPSFASCHFSPHDFIHGGFGLAAPTTKTLSVANQAVANTTCIARRCLQQTNEGILGK